MFVLYVVLGALMVSAVLWLVVLVLQLFGPGDDER